MPDDNYYKVGGSLEYQHPTYVVRQADADLYEGLKNGEFCYVLNSRQMGKSSLRVQMMKRLKEQGVKCASIDMTRIGSHVTQAEWYAGVISELLRGFSLSRKVNFSSWWRDREALPPLQRLRELIEDVLLVEFSQNLVIFVDEIDSIIKIKFKEDFFAFIRACYNQRVDNPEYNRLTFCLLGVATPSDLITDKNISTPFNIGRAIELTGFQLHEVQPLIQGLTGRVSRPELVIREVLEWTGGQPFLTQKLCKQILNWEKSILECREAECIEELVRGAIAQLALTRIIENWETQDEPEHLRTIRDRILWSSSKEQLLRLYQHILETGKVRANDTPEHMELRLSGLIVKEQGKLRVYNRLYASVFNHSWVEDLLAEADKNLVKVSAVESAIASLSFTPVVCDRITSERGIDYTRLCRLLAAGQWLEADLETTAIMLRIAGREAEGWLRERDVETFPCTDLLTIDQLWVKYSEGRFGFSVQKEIWKSVCGTKNADYEIYCLAAERLGWGTRLGGKEFSWLQTYDLTFNTTAPIGHLPGGLLDWLWSSSKESLLRSLHQGANSRSLRSWWNIISSITSRIEECNGQCLTPATVTSQQLLFTIHNQQQAAFLGELIVNEKFIRIYQGDITKLVTDAMVSSDDTYIQMSGGVSRRIREVGGNEIYKETRDLVPTILGNVAVTTAGKLRAKKIFHGVVIDWHKETLPSAGIIRQVVHKCIGKANECGFTSLAFPLLGTGAGRFPAKVCWKVTLSQIISDLTDYNQTVSEVIIVLYERRIIEELNLVNLFKKD